MANKNWYEAKIEIPKKKVDEYNRYLDSGEQYPDAGRYETVETFTAKFSKGYEADIKVCATWECDLFVDAVLFKDGCEVAVCDPEYALDGIFEFETDDGHFEVEVVAA